MNQSTRSMGRYHTLGFLDINVKEKEKKKKEEGKMVIRREKATEWTGQ